MKIKSFSPGLSPERLSDAYLAAMLSLFLLYPGFEGYGNITAHKAVLFVLLSLGYLAAVSCRREARAALRSKIGWPQRLVLGYWAFTALSTLCAVDRTTALWGGARREGFLVITLYCGVFFLLSAFARPKTWLLWVFAASVSLNCLLALIQLAGYNPLGLYPAEMTYQDAYVRYPGEYLGTIGNADLLSALLCIAVPVCWVGLLRLSGKSRLFLLIPLVLGTAVLLLARVEGGILGICGGALFSLPVVLPKAKQRRTALLFAAALLAASTGFMFFFGDRMGGFLYEAHALMHGIWDDSFGSGRLYIWHKVLALVPERPLLGGGPATLGLRTDAAFTRWDETLGATLRTTVDIAHNEYLNVLVNQGALALGCFLGALALCARQWVHTAARSPLATLSGAGVLGYCIQAFFGLSSPITTPFFWIALALLTAGSDLDELGCNGDCDLCGCLRPDVQPHGRGHKGEFFLR